MAAATVVSKSMLRCANPGTKKVAKALCGFHHLKGEKLFWFLDSSPIIVGLILLWLKNSRISLSTAGTGTFPVVLKRKPANDVALAADTSCDRPPSPRGPRRLLHHYENPPKN